MAYQATKFDLAVLLCPQDANLSEEHELAAYRLSRLGLLADGKRTLLGNYVRRLVLLERQSGLKSALKTLAISLEEDLSEPQPNEEASL